MSLKTRIAKLEKALLTSATPVENVIRILEIVLSDREELAAVRAAGLLTDNETPRPPRQGPMRWEYETLTAAELLAAQFNNAKSADRDGQG